MKTKQFYTISANGGDVHFKVLGTTHTQHNPDSTYINNLSKSAQKRINALRGNNKPIYVQIGTGLVTLNN
jgi:hypothetical protein